MIARVFPRRTKATPTDDYAFVGEPPMYLPNDITEVHVSVTFTWDLPEANRLTRAWEHIAPVKAGGPATGMRGEEFTPGMYIKPGYVITSRGCPNHCWFCSVWKREGGVRELSIMDGWNVLDDNFLATSLHHRQNVYGMLLSHKRPEFTGGLEAARLTEWDVICLSTSEPKQIFFAYDTADDYEPLVKAGKMLREIGGFTTSSHTLRAYVLVGHPKDTFDNAEKRLFQTVEAGFMPMAMLWRDESGKTDMEWRRFQRQWARPAIIASRKTATDNGTVTVDGTVDEIVGVQPK